MHKTIDILVVDDDLNLCRDVVPVLKQAGYQVTIAATAKACLRSLQKHPPHIVLLNPSLPDGDGIEVCHTIKTTPDTAGIFVILFVNPQVLNDDHVDNLETEADGYVVYPIDNRQLLTLVATLLRTQRIEDNLNQVVQEWQTTFDATNDAIWLLDTEQRIVHSNKTAEQLFQRPRSELLGKHCWEIVHGTDEPIAGCPLARTKHSLRRETVELQIGERWVQVNADPILDKNGQYTGAVHIVADITERKRAEAEMQQLLNKEAHSRHILLSILEDHKRTEQALQQNREQLRALASHLHIAQEKERAHLAREVHDEFGQALTALKIDLTWVDRHLSEEQHTLSNKIEEMIVLVDDTIQMVRRIATELRPGLLDDLGLVTTLEWQATEFARRTGIHCQLDLDQEALSDMLMDLERDLSTAIFRIFQEALTNIARHAQATEINIALRKEQNILVLTVRDNGIGLLPEVVSNAHSLGLLGMRERALFWQGSVKFEGVSGHGTTVTLRVPCVVNEENVQ